MKKNSYSAALKEKIAKDISSQILNIEKYNKLTEKLESKKYDRIRSLPKNVFYENVENTKNEKIIESNKFRINLSIPVFAENNKYCLIAFSNGFENSMSGGISIYKKDKEDNWIYFTSFNEWIE